MAAALPERPIGTGPAGGYGELAGTMARRAALPAETRKYVPAVMAYYEKFSNGNATLSMTGNPIRMPLDKLNWSPTYGKDIGNGQPTHTGEDLLAPCGTPVKAAFNGTITYRGCLSGHCRDGGEAAGALETMPGALEDLQARLLRVLHDRSFSDDPTRLLRLARYRGRLGFGIERGTGRGGRYFEIEGVPTGLIDQWSSRHHQVRAVIDARLRDKQSALEKVYAESKLRPEPDEDRIRLLLLSCPEDHYGSLENCVVDPDRAVAALRNVQAELEKVRDLL